MIQDFQGGITAKVIGPTIHPHLCSEALEIQIDMEHVLAVVTDEEYDFCCNVLQSNFAEPIRPVHLLDGQHLPACRADWPTEDSTHGAPSHHNAPDEAAQEVPAAAAPESFRFRLHLSTAVLELQQKHPRQTTPLARVVATHASINCIMAGSGQLDVRVCLPRVDVPDLRAERCSEIPYVLSMADQDHERILEGTGGAHHVAPNLLTLCYSCCADKQIVEVQLQRPTVLLDVDFIRAALKFVVPSLSLGDDPAPFASQGSWCGGLFCLQAASFAPTTLSVCSCDDPCLLLALQSQRTYNYQHGSTRAW